MAPYPRSALLVGAAVLSTLGLVGTGWLLGQGGSVPATAAVGSSTGSAAPDRARDGVLVSGTGTVYGRPDTLVAQFGTEAAGDTVDSALQRADRALARITRALLEGGVARADLQTAGLDIYPRYAESGSQVVGYQAAQQLRVTFRDLRVAGRLIGRAIAAGGNAARLSELALRIGDDSALLATARRTAFADARAKAQLYAAAADRRLGRVVSVTETVTGRAPQPQAYAYNGAAQDLRVAPGQQQVAVTVTVEWAFD